MAHNKRITKARSLVEKDRLYSIDSALDLLSQYGSTFKSKFDETVEVAFKLGVDPRHSDQMVRGAVPMPHGLGKKVIVAVFAGADVHKDAVAAGADIVGDEDLVDKVKGGYLDFDICISTPAFMPRMVSLGKILGTKGMMPNPKLGTVSEDVAKAVKVAKSGQVEYKVEKAGLIHAGVGKLSFALDAIKGNVFALYGALLNAKPSGAKGVYMQKMHITTTHGPSIAIDLKSMLV